MIEILGLKESLDYAGWSRKYVLTKAIKSVRNEVVRTISRPGSV
jgi:hypothetical protein